MSNIVRLPTGLAQSRRKVADRLKFTTGRIDALTAPASGSHYTYDTVAPHLAVRTTAAGAKAFVVVRKINGKAQRVTLGRFPGLGLDAARKAAAEIAGEVARGIDPSASRKLARVRQRTLADLWPSYETHIKRKNRSWARDRQRWLTHIEPALGRKALAGVTRADCQAVVDRVGKASPIAANRVASLLGAFLSYAVRTDALTVNPARGLVRAPERSRARILSSDEAPRLLAAIEDEPGDWSDVFAMLIYCGQRRGAVARMRWADVDIARQTWTLPAGDAKNGEATAITLPPPALALLERRKDVTGTSGWVFPSSRGDGPVVALARPWERICARARLVDFRIHDIRRSFGTMMARGGASPHVIATGLGHKSIASAKTYVRLVNEDARVAMAAAVDALMAPAKP